MTTDQWRPGIAREALIQRAAILDQIREFFKTRGVVEVDTPVLSQATVTDPYLQPIVVPDMEHSSTPRYLQTSPEYAMKRLLASGSGDIYQIAKAFRGGEVGRLHNPEFYLIEWYRLGFDIKAICHELSDLLSLVLSTETAQLTTYRDVFLTFLAIDIETTSQAKLTKLVAEYCPGLTCHDWDDHLTALFATVIEPQLGLERPVIISHYPASQASLARLDDQNKCYALRFEAFYKGIELANGFVELTDPQEQAERFKQDNIKREQLGLKPMPIDQNLLEALHSGLPDCSGVALGFERLMMLASGKTSITDVMPFNYENA